MIIGLDTRILADQNWSGVNWYLYYLLDELLAVDRHNTYILFYNGWHDQPKVLQRWAQYDNVKLAVSRWPNKFLNLSCRFLHWPKLDRLLGGCDIFLAPNLGFFSLSTKTKFMVVAHDLSYWRYQTFFNWRQRLWHYLVSPQKLFLAADKIITVSVNSRQELSDVLPGLNDKITTIYPGLPPAASVEVLNDLPNEFFLSLATREPRKNLSGLIKGYEIFRQQSGKNIGLVVAGGSGWLSQDLQAQIAASPYLADIKLLGYVSQGQKTYLYQRAKALLYPSFYEGFGFPPLEAMSCGCPVISAISFGTSEVCHDAALLVEPHHVEQIAAALSLVISPAREGLMAAGQQRAANFTWSKTAEQFLDIFRQYENRH